MKLFKSLLLASAAGMVAVSGASAADLGAKKPSPVEYVKACYNPLWGTSGGFIIPGGNTCLRVFGQARFDYQYTQQFNRSSSPSGYRGGATIGLDAITPSEFGNVRAFAAISATYRSGNQFSGTNIRNGVAIAGSFPAATGSAGQTEIGYTGFIQFAGLTMGRTSSFFRTVGAPNEVIGNGWYSGPGNVTTIAYTAQLGNGFLATIALEDPTIRRFGVASGSYVNTALASVTPNTASAFGSNVANFTQIGNRMPNVVASLRVDQAWGSAEVSGMINEVGVVGNIAGAALTPAAGLAFTPSTKYGFAIAGGLKINLPMLAAGDNLTLNAVYSEGNLSSVLSVGGGNSFQGINVGGTASVTPDAVFNTASGNMRLTKAFGVTAGLQHFWTPTLNSTLFASYAKIDVANQALTVADTLRDFTLATVGLNTIWTPVRGLSFALEGAYVMHDPQGRMLDVNKNVVNASTGANTFNIGACVIATGVGCRTKSSDSQFFTRFRVTRDF
jgi:Porin subfamily